MKLHADPSEYSAAENEREREHERKWWNFDFPIPVRWFHTGEFGRTPHDDFCDARDVCNAVRKKYRGHDIYVDMTNAKKPSGTAAAIAGVLDEIKTHFEKGNRLTWEASDDTKHLTVHA